MLLNENENSHIKVYNFCIFVVKNHNGIQFGDVVVGIKSTIK